MCIVTPIILVSGRIHLKALPQKMQLNEVGVGSAIECQMGWLGGRNDRDSQWPFSKKNNVSKCLCQSFPGKSAVKTELEPLKVWKSSQSPALQPLKALQHGITCSDCAFSMWRQPSLLQRWRDKGVAWTHWREEGRGGWETPISTPYNETNDKKHKSSIC